jgi:F-type H+-transporting ATPase subunit b
MRALLYRAMTAVVLTNLSVQSVAADDHAHAPSIGDLKVYWFNFIIYIGILYFALRKLVPAAWAARRERIRVSLHSASAALNAAEQELNAVQNALKTLQEPSKVAGVVGELTEIQRLRADVLRDGQAEAQRIVQDAEQRAARLRTQAREQLEGEVRTAQSAVRAQLVQRAVASARTRFSQGDFAHRDTQYREAAVQRAKRLID